MQRRTKKACQDCGRSFYGGQDCFYCPDCAKRRKSSTVERLRSCQDCGIEFFGGPRAKRCPDCAIIAKREADRKNKKEGVKRPLGSVDRCTICWKEYVVASGRQKYCSADCQRKGVLEWQREHKKGYASLPEQDEKKKERRSKQKKICIYCLRQFKSNIPTNTCSAFCKSEQKKFEQCVLDIKRGRKRNLKRYEEMREEYRKKD